MKPITLEFEKESAGPYCIIYKAVTPFARYVIYQSVETGFYRAGWGSACEGCSVECDYEDISYGIATIDRVKELCQDHFNKKAMACFVEAK